MKKVGIAYFTEPGRKLALRLASGMEGAYEILWYERGLRLWCGECFAQAEALIFIGACGIAVRTVAPFLKSKTEDPAVLVMDEAGQYVISLLSGHLGGANEFALQISELTGARPVITTASDVRGKLAVDVFAKKNELSIDDMKAAKEIAAAILSEKPVGLYCSGEIEGEIPPELMRCEGAFFRGHHLIWISERKAEEAVCDSCRVLHLIPGAVTVGIGCRRGTAAAEIEQAVHQVLAEERIPRQAVLGAASIDLKKDEEGLLFACRNMELPFVTYPAETLSAIPGTFTSSAFVRKVTGVDNVCERAALALAGVNGKLIRKKYAQNGVTVALAVREWRIHFEK